MSVYWFVCLSVSLCAFGDSIAVSGHMDECLLHAAAGCSGVNFLPYLSGNAHSELQKLGFIKVLIQG